MAPLKVCIVGAVAAGMTCAVRMRRIREDIEIHVFEKTGDISIASCGIPYYVGGEITDRGKMALVDPAWAKARHNILVHVNSEVVAIDRKGKKITIKDHSANGALKQETYDKLVITTGSKPVTAGLPGVNLKGVYTMRDLVDMDMITAEATGANRSAVVIGAGYIGVETAENLINRKVDTTVVELLPQILPTMDPEMTVPLQAAMENAGVKVLLNSKTTGITEVTEGGVRKLAVGLSDGKAIKADFVMLCIGVEPDTKLAAEAGLQMGVNNTIVVDDRMRTTDPDIYAAGDAVQVVHRLTGQATRVPLAGPAVRQARVAAAQICGHGDERFGPVLGTAVVKAFGITSAIVGLNEKMVKHFNIADAFKFYTYPPTKVDWFPGSTPLLLKFFFNRVSGAILGIQVVGREGVEKRVDTISVAIQAGMTVRQLSQVELAYSPQYNGPKDPVNVAGMIASNIMDGLTHFCYSDDLPKDMVVLDVRELPELKEQGAAPGTIHIPCGVLRGRLSELPKDRPIGVMCKVGHRANHVMRLLRQNGFNALDISGGQMVYNLWHNPAKWREFIQSRFF